MSEFDVTKLWHVRLIHLSEKGLTLLTKKGFLCGQSTDKLEFYEYYVFGKQKHVSFSTSTIEPKILLNTSIKSFKPPKIPLERGYKYMLILINIFLGRFGFPEVQEPSSFHI